MEKSLHIISAFYATLKMSRKNGPVPPRNRAVLFAGQEKKKIPESNQYVSKSKQRKTGKIN